MGRPKIKRILIEFEDPKYKIPPIEVQKNGKYRYTGMVWDDAAVGPLLAKYYPVAGVKCTVQMSGQLSRMNREHIDIKGNAPSGKKDYDETNIYPSDIMHLWRKGVLLKDENGNPYYKEPCVLLKTMQSPPHAEGHSTKTFTFGQKSFDLVVTEFGDLSAIVATENDTVGGGD